MHIVKNREKTKHLGEKQPVDEKHPKCPGLCKDTSENVYCMSIFVIMGHVAHPGVATH